MLVWLCRWTALHRASRNGHKVTAMALVKAGADVHCKDNDGYGFLAASWSHRHVTQCGADGPSTRAGAAGVAVWLCRRTALHYASSNGYTATAMALVKAGADVRCKANDGYGFSRLHPRVGWVSDSVGADGPSTRGGAAEVSVWAVQEYGAAHRVE